MKPVRAVVATAVLLAACRASTELLPPADSAVEQDGQKLAFCPTSIDVYGGGNIALVGCSGNGFPPPGGYYAPDTNDYDQTLAGRLRSRLANDPGLIPVFGTSWNVTSCATGLESLSQLAPPLSADQCSGDTPQAMGFLSGMCAGAAAPLLLISADALDDRCHGGGPDSMARVDDAGTYADHLATRLDLFLGARQPKAAIVGPKTEWEPLPPPPNLPPDPRACQWKRPGWNRDGVALWQQRRTISLETMVIPDLQDQFKQHHPCCRDLNVPCATNWFSTPAGPTAVNCDGAQAIVDHWYSNLRQFLLTHEFQCP